MRPIDSTLDVARWAPSGDNTQPWRFEIGSDDHVVVHAFDTRDHCVYDLDGRPSQLSVGTLLETIRIAATNFGLRANYALRVNSKEGHPVFDVTFVADPSIAPSELIPSIQPRRVRALQTRAIRPEEKARLEGNLPPGYQFWLTATQLGLKHQPEMTLLISSRYIRQGIRFTRNRRAVRIATRVSRRLGEIVGLGILRCAVWMGRIGAGQPAEARSLRLSLERLLFRG